MNKNKLISCFMFLFKEFVQNPSLFLSRKVLIPVQKFSQGICANFTPTFCFYSRRVGFLFKNLSKEFVQTLFYSLLTQKCTNVNSELVLSNRT